MSKNAQTELIEVQKQARRRLIYAIILVISVMLVSWYLLGKNTDSATDAANTTDLEASGGIALETSTPLASIELGVAGIPSSNAIASTEIIATIPSSTLPPTMSGESKPYPSTDNLASAVTNTPVTEVEIDPIFPPMIDETTNTQPSKTTNQAPKIEVPKTQATKKEPPKKDTPKNETSSKSTKTESNKLDPLAILNGATTPAPSTKSNASASSYTINLGAFASPDSIANIKKKNESMGLPIKYTAIDKDGTSLTRVRIGPFDSAAQAEAAQKTLSQAGLGEGLLVVNK
jgi:DedD protein